MNDSLLIEIDTFSKDLSGIHMAVIGDLMIDRYIYGTVNRISPEAPVQVVLQNYTKNHLGGAANVVSNLKALGVHTAIFGITGNDQDALIMEELLLEIGVDHLRIIKDDSRPTTIKTRVMSQGHQLLRIDQEKDNELDDKIQSQLLADFKDYVLSQPLDMVILEDYNKGIFHKNVIQNILAFCAEKGIKVAVDPKKENFFMYQGVDLFKPNLKEALQAMGSGPTQTEDLHSLGNQLISKISCKKLMITLAGEGIWIQDLDTAQKYSTQHRKISDVSGAGDTVISLAAVCRALSLSDLATALICNTGGGQVCEIPGVAPINKARLLKEVYENLPKKGNFDQA